MSIKTVHEQLRALNLNQLVEMLENNYLEYQNKGLDFYEILDLVLDSEINQRHNKKATSLIKTAKLRYATAKFEDMDYSPARKIKKSNLTPLFDLNWIEKKQGIVITGSTGTGKTWTACAFGNLACRKEIKTNFINCNQLYDELYVALLNKTIHKVSQKYIKSRLLILDDFGLGAIHAEIIPDLVEIIDLQSKYGGLIVTSQYPIHEWHNFFENKMQADSILDRIVHRSYKIDLAGESMRKILSIA